MQYAVTHPKEEILAAVEDALQHLEGYDQEFYRRVWATEMEIYCERLRAVGMVGKDHVLDAGSGNGQWTYCLSQTNGQVAAIDVNTPRLKATEHVLEKLGVQNIEVSKQSIEKTNFPDGSFDAIFCYGVMMFCDHRVTLAEFYRLLKPGGSIYICTNGLGWYIYNVMTPHNPSDHFDVRQMAISAIRNGLAFFAEGRHPDGEQLVVPSHVLSNDAQEAGFADLQTGPEGTLTLEPNCTPQSFFMSEFQGLEGVYELVANKSAAN
ncbi:class I SAM-dependent methyltransferase [Roseimaritima ulvae]|uniref:Ubiquinone/menaquinone biosynthesis C-methyltransferase UbiE n=1 Tax=Roseimaritima ulvae TaxID=980254 RepID=A0A5B9QXG6_9BACT|nr:class I SAM-dependent methyltransferase [Roseimaritima ulvae]QEG38653.1 Ubiquinone/menaquinone biosynthesis C-methyltransferase UbiE [Roseimaritima ulvae]